MSGHSKWHRIKRKKEAADAKRGQQFDRLAEQIKTAARSGRDPAANPALKEAVAQAKRANMPQANIDRLLGDARADATQTAVYEVFGPSGTGLLVIAATDNGRRTAAEVRAVLAKHGGSLGQPGSVKWKFEATPQQQYRPKYPSALIKKDRRKVNDLKRELMSLPDIKQVHADTD